MVRLQRESLIMIKNIVSGWLSNKSSGQSIIEILVATVVVGVIVTAVAIGVTYSVRNTAEIRYRETAVKLGSEVMELVSRERRRLGWTEFQEFWLDLDNTEGFAESEGGSTHCVVPDLSGSGLDNLLATQSPPNCPSLVVAGTDFVRELTVVSFSSDQLVLEVGVYWTHHQPQDRSITLRQRYERRSTE